MLHVERPDVDGHAGVGFMQGLNSRHSLLPSGVADCNGSRLVDACGLQHLREMGKGGEERSSEQAMWKGRAKNGRRDEEHG